MARFTVRAARTACTVTPHPQPPESICLRASFQEQFPGSSDDIDIPAMTSSLISTDLSKWGNTMCLQGKKFWRPSPPFPSASTRGWEWGGLCGVFPFMFQNTTILGPSCLADTRQSVLVHILPEWTVLLLLNSTSSREPYHFFPIPSKSKYP